MTTRSTLPRPPSVSLSSESGKSGRVEGRTEENICAARAARLIPLSSAKKKIKVTSDEDHGSVGQHSHASISRLVLPMQAVAVGITKSLAGSRLERREGNGGMYGRTDERKEASYTKSSVLPERRPIERRAGGDCSGVVVVEARRPPLDCPFSGGRYNTPPENLSKLTIKFRKLDTDAVLLLSFD